MSTSRDLMKFEALTTHCVSVGSLPPRVRKTLLKNGTRKSSMPVSTRVAKIRTIVGYIIAPLTRLFSFVSRSIWYAMRSSTWSRMPAASPASTIATKRRVKTFGCRSIAWLEQQTAFDVRAQLADDLRQVLVVGLLLEDDERGDDAEAGLDHRRELAREDLQRLRLDLLERPSCAPSVAGGREAPRASRRAGRGCAAARARRRASGAWISPSERNPCALIAL